MPLQLGISLSGIQTAQFDPDALTFINVAAITDTTQRYAINNLVVDLKLNGLWSKMKAIYPMVGGNAISHSYNLKNTAQYNLTFNGGWTHGVTGAYPNGINAYAQTGLNASTVLSTDSTHLSFYSITNSPAAAGVGKVDIGCQVAPTTSYFLGISTFALFIAYMYSNAVGARIQVAQGTTTAGLALATRQSSSSLKAFFNRYSTSAEGFVEIASVTALAGSLPNNEVYLSVNGFTGNLYEYSDRGCGIATIGDGLSDSEVQTFGAIIQKYVNTLGRQQISIPTVQDLDAQSFLVAAGITDSTQATAISNLTTGLKYRGLWSKMGAIYPFVGGVSTSHRTNLKSPSNSNSAYRLLFSGGWTQSSTGALPNGTNAYADTNYSMTTTGQNDTHISVYLRTNLQSASSTIDMGVSTAGGVFTIIETRTGGANTGFGTVNASTFNTPTNTNSTGHWVVSRTASNDNDFYRNGSVLSNGIQVSAAGAALNFYLGARNSNGSAGNYAARQIAFASMGTGLTATEVSDFYTLVQTYQTALARQI